MSLNILQLVSGEGKAGSTKSVILLIKGLLKRGHRVIVAVSPESYNYNLMKEAGFEVVSIEMKSRYDFKSAKKIVNLCRQEKIDIINAHLSTDRYLAIWAKFLGAKAKIILTRRAISRSSRFVSFLYRIGADKIIAVSKAVKESLCSQGIPDNRIEVVYNGIPDDFGSVNLQKIEELKRKYNISPEDKIIGMIARWDKLKGHDILLSALKEIKSDYKVLLVGIDESFWPEVEAFGLGDRVILCGFEKDIAPFYHLMTLKVLPSFAEGFSLSVMEAMACGVCVLGSDIPSISEIIEPNKNGLLFETGNSEDLAEKIKILLNDETLRIRLAKQGERIVQERFSIERTVEAMEKIYMDRL
ncbi:MAG: glycosyltransferase family 4 protein [Candidatus Desantisbacteria bacterium]